MRTHYSKEITPALAGKAVSVAGWVQEIRDFGGLKFLIIRDRTGTTQVTINKKKAPAGVVSVSEGIGKEYVISVSGTVKEMKQAPNGVELIPESISVISAAESPLPMELTKVVSDLDTRLTSRFIDLRRPEVMSIFFAKTCALTAVREAMDSHRFVEIQTPKIVAAGAEGGATLFPITYFEREAFLAQSPQLFKQSLMSTGLDRVYEIGPSFRAEESDTTRHISEFWQWDAEMAFINSYEDVMNVLEDGVARAIAHVKKDAKPYLDIMGVDLRVPKTPFRRIEYDEALEILKDKGKKIEWGDDIDTEGEKAIGGFVAEEYEEELYFITHYPEKIKPFYIHVDDDKRYCSAFDLEYRGLEIASGGQREHDYEKLTGRMRKFGLDLDSFDFYLKAFRYGMPPHGGWGFGLDRFVQQMLGLKNVREVILFPRDRKRLVP